MVAAWKAAGFTYNKYLSIAARVVRRSLKDDVRLKAERRGEIDLKFSHWQNGKQQDAKNITQTTQIPSN